jgi:hypothetical protein
MDPPRLSIVAEVKGGEVEEVDDEHDLRENKVSADEEHHKRELEQIVEDEVTTNARSCLYVGRICGEQMPHVSNLK